MAEGAELDAALDEFEAAKPDSIMTDEEVAPSPFTHEEIEADQADLDDEEAEHERRTWKGALVEMKGKTEAEVHIVHTHLEEIHQHLDGAIAKSEGNVKSFLKGLKAHL